MKSEIKTYKGVKGGVYSLIDTLPKFEWFIEQAKNQVALAVDTETTGLDWVKSYACGIVIGWGVENNYYLPIAHRNNEDGGPSLERQLNLEDIRKPLQDLLGNPSLTTYWWNVKYDLHILRNAGIEVGGVKHDGVVLSYLLNENAFHGLKAHATEHIDSNADKWELAVKEWRFEESKRRRRMFNLLVKEKAAELKLDLELYAKIANEVDTENVVEVSDDESLTKRRRTAAITARFKEMAIKALHGHYMSYNKLDHISYDFIPLETMVPYAAADVHYTWLRCKDMCLQVVQHPTLKDLYICELQISQILFEMEHRGVHIDRAYLDRIGPEMEAKIKECADTIFQQIGYVFNLDSDGELINALQKSGCTLRKLTKASYERKEQGDTDKPLTYSVDRIVLEELASKYEFAALILEYRSLKKLKSTYRDTILEKLDSKDNLHPQFNQVVRTGRMSSSGGVNCQNIPAKDKRIRRAFITPDNDHLMVFIDYSQIELRLLAEMSQDPKMLSCYPKEGEGLDVHSLTCAEAIMGMSYDDFLSMRSDNSAHNPATDICECRSCKADFYRKIAKVVNFGIPYGVGPTSLQTQISTPQRPITLDQCNEYIESWFNRYKGVKKWIDNEQLNLLKYSEVQNLFGRLRRFPGIRQSENKLKFRAYRQGVNYKIQGSAADLFKVALTRVDKAIDGTGISLVNVVHDEIQFYWPKDKIYLVPEIKKVMEDFNFTVPIIVDVSYSDTSWGDKKELNLDEF